VTGTDEGLELFRRYREKGILLDTNLLFVYVMGKCGPERLATSKRAQAYTQQDFENLESMIEGGFFSKLYTTPNVLTEVSNLAPRGDFRFFEVLAAVTDLLEEKYYPSSVPAHHDLFWRLGLTDTCLFAAQQEFLVFTDDLTLCHQLQAHGVDAVNFNWYRTLALPGN